MTKKKTDPSESEPIQLTSRQMEQLAKDAAICAAGIQLWLPTWSNAASSKRLRTAARRIFKVLKLEDL